MFHVQIKATDKVEKISFQKVQAKHICRLCNACIAVC
jgi:hypothetical protein